MRKTKLKALAGILLPDKTGALAAHALAAGIERVATMGIDELRALWRSTWAETPPEALTKELMARALCHQLQEEAFGGPSAKLKRRLISIADKGLVPERQLKIGSTIVRGHQGRVHEVIVVPRGFLWSGQTYPSLSAIARKITGTRWSGPKFFGLAAPPGAGPRAAVLAKEQGKVGLGSRPRTAEPVAIFEGDAAEEGIG